MSRWSEEFEGHPIHVMLTSIGGAINTEFSDIEEQEIAERRRANKVLGVYKTTLENIDPELTPLSSLTQLVNEFNSLGMTGQIESYSQEGSLENLVEINNILTVNLSSLSSLLAISKKIKQSAVVTSIEKAVDDTANTLIAKKDDLEKDLSNLSDKIESAQVELSSIVSLSETRKQEIDNHLTQWQQQFSDAQEKRGNDFLAWRESFKDEAVTDLNASQEKLESDIKIILDDASNKHQSILELYELTAGDSVAGGYISNASYERTQANIWRLVSIFFIALTGLWLFNSYDQLSIASEAINWGKIFSVLSLSGVLLYGAAYSSQQSNAHRRQEKQARTLALKMKAFDPFISSLDEEVQKELKKRTAEYIFQNDVEQHENEPLINEHAFSIVSKTISEILSKVPK